MDHPFSDSNQAAQPRLKGELQDQAGFSDQKLISDWVEQIGLGFRNVCHRHNIEISMDLEEVRDAIEPKTIKAAVIAMVNHAIEAMPNGGDLEITLIDGDHQWEVEVADSGPHRTQLPRDRESIASIENVVSDEFAETSQADDLSTVGLPSVEAVSVTRHMKNLENLAFELGATLQAWNCPLGGMAHVMIVPKNQYPGSEKNNQTSGTSPSLGDGFPNNDQRKAA